MFWLYNENGFMHFQDTSVWVPHTDRVWEGAILLNDFDVGDSHINLETESGIVKKVVINGDADLPPLKNPLELIGQNDLVALSYLNEPNVLHELKVRYGSL